MPTPPTSPLTPRRLPEGVRRRLEVTTAMAWEALVEAHTRYALHFVALLGGRLDLRETLDRYLREMRLPESMAASVRTRVLVSLEDVEPVTGPGLPIEQEDAGDEGWRRFRPGILMRGVKERRRRDEAAEAVIKLALARAEEGVILTHVDNALSFAALLDPYLPLDRAVAEYVDAMELVGGRAQAVFQRAMARLAEVHLPPVV